MMGCLRSQIEIGTFLLPHLSEERFFYACGITF